MNKVMLIGNAGKDAELRYTANGFATASWSLAVNGRRKNAAGEWEDETEWFNCVLLGEQAEKLAQYVTKGKPVYVEGRQKTRSWEDDKGDKHYWTEVIVNSLQLLGTVERAASSEYEGMVAGGPVRAGERWDRGKERNEANRKAGPAVDDIDDLPFE